MSTQDPGQRTVALRQLLSRLWRQRDAHRWTVHGRDECGRRTRVRVGFSNHGVTLDVSRAGSLVLAPLQAGRLRGAIRDAIHAIERPDLAAQRITQVDIAEPTAKPRPPSPRSRERVALDDREPALRRPFQSLDVTRHAHRKDNMILHAPNAPSSPLTPCARLVKENSGGVG